MLPLRDLLSGALNRARAGRSLLAVRIVEACQEALQKFFPFGGEKDFRVLSFRDGIIVVECLNAPAAHAVSERRVAVEAVLMALFPEAAPFRLCTRIVSGFHGRMEE